MSFIYLALSVLLALWTTNTSAGPVLLLDDFNSGDLAVTTTVNSSFGQPVPGVFGGNRTLLLIKEVEASAASLVVGGGVLTFNAVGSDFGGVVWGSNFPSSRTDLSLYDAFRITVESAPQNAGTVDFVLWYPGDATHYFGVRATVAISGPGVVDIPFSTLRSDASFPPVDFAHASAITMDLGDGRTLARGTYVFDNFEAIVLASPPTGVPEPSTPPLIAIALGGLIASAAARRGQ